MRVALVSRDEVHPLAGGGIAVYVNALAEVLSPVAEVTIFATSLLRERYESLRAAGDPRLPRARLVFVEEPTAEEVEGWYHVMHCYSARVWESLQEVYADRPPDLIEFADYLGEGCVTLQAAHVMDPFLSRTRILVRLHTSAELGELLNGYCKPDLGSRVVHEMERLALAAADSLLWGGGDVLGTYRRYYGQAMLAPGVRIRHPFPDHLSPPQEPDSRPEDEHLGDAGRLNFVYAGRLERRKGVIGLLAAAIGLAREDFSLTLVGGDTDTGPGGRSVLEQLEALAAGDERVRILPAVSRGELAAVLGRADVVVVPSAWECWPYAALEALHLNRPVLGTPVGGLVEMLIPGRSGWLTAGTTVAELTRGLEGVLDARAEVEELRRSGSPLQHWRSLCEPQEIVAAYGALAGRPLTRPVKRRHVPGGAEGLPLVSVIVAHTRSSRAVAATVQSALAQSRWPLEILIVNDGRFDPEDRLADLAAQMPVRILSQIAQGRGAAWNFGVSQTRGRYVIPLAEGWTMAPDFIARCLEPLEARPELAYVTSWWRYLAQEDPPAAAHLKRSQPLGNQARLIAEECLAGPAAALIPREILESVAGFSEELSDHQSWQLYRELHQAGRYGAVIPARLLACGADPAPAERGQALRERLRGEMNALSGERSIRWTALSA